MRLADEAAATSLDLLHGHLSVYSVQGLEATEKVLQQELRQLQSDWGVILFLYSAMLSSGLETVQQDLGFDQDPLISMPFGHAK